MAGMIAEGLATLLDWGLGIGGPISKHNKIVAARKREAELEKKRSDNAKSFAKQVGQYHGVVANAAAPRNYTAGGRFKRRRRRRRRRY